MKFCYSITFSHEEFETTILRCMAWDATEDGFAAHLILKLLVQVIQATAPITFKQLQEVQMEVRRMSIESHPVVPNSF